MGGCFIRLLAALKFLLGHRLLNLPIYNSKTNYEKIPSNIFFLFFNSGGYKHMATWCEAVTTACNNALSSRHVHLRRICKIPHSPEKVCKVHKCSIFPKFGTKSQNRIYNNNKKNIKVLINAQR